MIIKIHNDKFGGCLYRNGSLTYPVIYLKHPRMGGMFELEEVWKGPTFTNATPYQIEIQSQAFKVAWDKLKAEKIRAEG